VGILGSSEEKARNNLHLVEGGQYFVEVELELAEVESF